MNDMQTKLEAIRSQFSEYLSTVEGSDALQSLKIRFLGKKGELTQLLRSLGNLPAEERPLAGQALSADLKYLADRTTVHTAAADPTADSDGDPSKPESQRFQVGSR